jgi:hypothetical protein
VIGGGGAKFVEVFPRTPFRTAVVRMFGFGLCGWSPVYSTSATTRVTTALQRRVSRGPPLARSCIKEDERNSRLRLCFGLDVVCFGWFVEKFSRAQRLNSCQNHATIEDLFDIMRSEESPRSYATKCIRLTRLQSVSDGDIILLS